MEKRNEYLAKMQEQMTVRKTLLEHGKIRLIPESSQLPLKQKGQEKSEQEELEKEKQLALIPRDCP